jgi:hypothetical protein
MSLRWIIPSLSIEGIIITRTFFDITQCATDCSR